MILKKIMSYTINKLFLILLLINWSVEQLISPCPNVFTYRGVDSKRSKWHGTLLLSTKEDSLLISTVRLLFDGEAADVQVDKARYPQISIDTLDNTEYLLDGISLTIRKGKTVPIYFSVFYTPGGYIPRLTAYRINEITVCSQTFSVGSAGEVIVQTATSKPSGNTLQNNNEFTQHLWTSGPQPQVTRPVSNKPSSNGQQQVCGTRVQNVTPLIVHGKASGLGQWPWHAALYSVAEATNIKYLCGSSLISTKHVLTAAHCVAESPRSSTAISPPDVLLFVFGKLNLTSWSTPGLQEINAVHIAVHPMFNGTSLAHDIAIVRLVREIEITRWVRPICLWPGHKDSAIQYLENKIGTIVGWGITEKTALSNELQYANIPVVSFSECFYKDVDFYSQFLTPFSFCAGVPGNTSACNGDSGGGMFFREDNADIWYVRGIVSLTAQDRFTGYCDVSHYVVFTDIVHFMPWIQQQLAIK